MAGSESARAFLDCLANQGVLSAGQIRPVLADAVWQEARSRGMMLRDSLDGARAVLTAWASEVTRLNPTEAEAAAAIAEESYGSMISIANGKSGLEEPFPRAGAIRASSPHPLLWLSVERRLGELALEIRERQGSLRSIEGVVAELTRSAGPVFFFARPRQEPFMNTIEPTPLDDPAGVLMDLLEVVRSGSPEAALDALRSLTPLQALAAAHALTEKDILLECVHRVRSELRQTTESGAEATPSYAHIAEWLSALSALLRQTPVLASPGSIRNEYGAFLRRQGGS